MKQTVMKEISNILNKVKGIGTAHSTDNDQAMLISSNEVVYLCNIVDVGKGHIASYFSELADVKIPVFKNAQNILSTQERLIEIFNAVKGFEAGFITSRMDAFMLVHKNLAYGLFLQELDKEGLIDNIHELFTVSKQKDLESLSQATFAQTTIGDLVVKEEIFEQVVLDLADAIKFDSDVFNLGFTKCLGKMEDVYPTFPENIKDDWYRTWIWENEKGQRIATWDDGNSHCSYMCEGSFDSVLSYLKGRIEELEYLK